MKFPDEILLALKLFGTMMMLDVNNFDGNTICNSDARDKLDA